MRKFLSAIYKHHSLIYKIFLFVISTLFIVYLFPKGGSFKYDFEKGKVWQTENLYAPFDFAVQKTEAQISIEEELLKENIPYYFTLDTIIAINSSQKLLKEFELTFSDSFNLDLKNRSRLKLEKTLAEIYKIGLLAEDVSVAKEKEIVLKVENSGVAKNYIFANLLTTEKIQESVQETFSDSIYNPYKNYFTALFFNNIKANVSFDKAFNE